MNENKDDPIVILAGLPFGLKEFVKAPENKNITGRFQKIFTIPDYNPAQLNAITEHELKKQGFNFSPEASEHLLKRYKYLYKEFKKPDADITALNGYLAIREAHSIMGSYYEEKRITKQCFWKMLKDSLKRKKPSSKSWQGWTILSAWIILKKK
jgi:hypothetical protein